ncbi:MAG: PPC domain-containing protein [Planctomycetota bacterium]|nr:PPC domain-containing protein [Planctomycetota bacterium]
MNKSFVFQYGVLSVCIFATFQFVYAEGGADGHGALAPNNSEPTPEATMTDRFGIGFVPVPELIMPAIDVIGYLKEDELGDKSGAFRFAIERSIDLTIDDGQWIDVVDGRLWRVDIRMDGALSSRLHISGLNLAEGHELALVSPDSEQPLTGILTGTGEFGTGEAYGICTPSILSRIEWFVPTGQDPKQLPFREIYNSYGYRDVFGSFQQVGGTCSLNPSCYAAWANESNAAFKLLFTSGGGGYLCSGQLMASTAADETPYASTANHCISTSTEANSAQFQFFYRANTCAGTNSSGTTVSGADLTATYATSDCTLMTVRGALPAGVWWAGWTNTSPTNSTASTGIHHPSGTPQAISFGSKISTNNFCGSGSNWQRVSWNNGITEGGSSGSAIYRDSDHKLYGVLTCGASSCSNPGGDDGYGRWDVAVNSGGFATPLAAGSDDAQEPNDSCAAPKALGVGTYTALVVKRLDEDWYALSVPVGSALWGSFTYTHGNGDIDLQLFSACGTTAVAQWVGNVNNNTISYTNTSASSTLYLRVFLATDTRNDYSMTLSITTPPPANDLCSGAIAIGNGAFSFNTTSATTTTLNLPTSCNEGAGVACNRDIWYRYTPSCTGTATASTCGAAAFDSRIAVYGGASCPTSTSVVSACSDNAAGCAASTSKASWAVSAGSVWYVRIGTPGTTGGTGTLTTSCASACTADRNGDNLVDALDLGIMLGAWGTAAQDLSGDGMTDGIDLGILLGYWGACP